MRAADTYAGGFPDLSGMPVARQLHWQRWFAAAAIVLVLAAIGRAFVNGQIEWSFRKDRVKQLGAPAEVIERVMRETRGR